MGEVFVSFICFRQRDIKSLINYSYVAHIGLVVAGTSTYTIWDMEGSLGMLAVHGLCSSSLFCPSSINYERLGRRSLLVNQIFARNF